MARHVRQGDMVKVTAGNDRGRTGRVLKVEPKKNRVVVEGVNRRYKHVRPNQQNPQGGRIQQELPIHISNVSPIAPSTQEATRVRFQTKEDGSKVRLAARTGEELSTLKKPQT